MKEFSYLDQFINQKVDLTEYIKFLSKQNNYPLKLSNLQPTITTIKNLFYQTHIINSYKSKIVAFDKYQVKDNETPDYIAYKQYGSPDFWWVIIVFNDPISDNPFGKWILTNEELLEYAYLLEQEENEYPHDVYYDLLFEMNENFRNIYILKTNYLYDLIWEFRQEIIKRQQNLI